ARPRGAASARRSWAHPCAALAASCRLRYARGATRANSFAHAPPRTALSRAMRLAPPTARSDAVRVAFAYAALFTVNAAGLAWLPVWLAGRGLTGEAVGLVIAASMMARLVLTPAAGYWADVTGRTRRVLVAAA